MSCFCKMARWPPGSKAWGSQWLAPAFGLRQSSGAFRRTTPPTAPEDSFYYPQLCGEFRPIPKGLRPLAQGCEARATLGGVPESGPTPTGLRRAPHDDATPLGLIPIPCGFPKVARASQPWALSRNPVGIRFLDARKLWVIEREDCRSPRRCRVPPAPRLHQQLQDASREPGCENSPLRFVLSRPTFRPCRSMSFIAKRAGVIPKCWRAR